MTRIWSLSLVLLAGCPAADDEVPSDDTDVVVETGCLEAEVALDSPVTQQRTVEGSVTVTSTCAASRTVGPAALDVFTVGFELDAPEATVLQSGDTYVVGVTFEATEPGVFADNVLVDVEGEDPLEVPVEVEVLAPELVVEAAEDPLVRTCPSTVAITVGNTGGATAEITVESVTVAGADVPLSLEGDALSLSPDAEQSFLADVTLQAASSELVVSLDEVLIGPSEHRFTLSADASAEREQLVPAWTEGRPVDVFVQVDRTMPDYDARLVEEGLSGLVRALGDLDVDYRIIGLLNEDGCALGRSAPIDPSLSLDDAVSRLSGHLDLAFNRGGETGVEDQPLTLVTRALSSENTDEGACNAWRRDDAAVLFVVVGHRDDAGTRPVEDELASLRGRVPFDDHLAISALAPRDCDSLPDASRLQEAAALTGGAFVPLCDGSGAESLSSVARSPGEENRIRLTDVPYPPSLEVLADGRAVEATRDGRVLTLPRTVDRLRSDITIRYVTAASCPGE